MFLSKGVSTMIRQIGSTGLLTRTHCRAVAVPRLMVARSFSVGDTFGKKEKVEEDRYMRELEAKYMETKKKEMAAKMAAEEETEFKETIAPIMAQAEVLISQSGESVSMEALEALARWKLGK